MCRDTLLMLCASSLCLHDRSHCLLGRKLCLPSLPRMHFSLWRSALITSPCSHSPLCLSFPQCSLMGLIPELSVQKSSAWCLSSGFDRGSALTEWGQCYQVWNLQVLRAFSVYAVLVSVHTYTNLYKYTHTCRHTHKQTHTRNSPTHTHTHTYTSRRTQTTHIHTMHTCIHTQISHTHAHTHSNAKTKALFSLLYYSSGCVIHRAVVESIQGNDKRDDMTLGSGSTKTS